MNFFELIEHRYSVRAYQSTPVEPEKLEKILNAARLAPTAANRQPFRILVASTAGKEDNFRRIYHREWMTSAPLVLIVCALPGAAWVRGLDGYNGAETDAAIVMTHILLAAAELELGTCWIASFNVQAVRQAFGIPSDVAPMSLTPLGYAAVGPHPKERKSLEELVCYEHWR